MCVSAVHAIVVGSLSRSERTELFMLVDASGKENGDCILIFYRHDILKKIKIW